MLKQTQYEVSPSVNEPIIFTELQRKRKRARRITYALLIFVPTFTYFIKYVIFSIGHQGTMGFEAIFLLPIMALPIIVMIGSEVWFIAYLKRHKDAIPAIAAIPLVYVALNLPMLPFIPNDAERHFYAHRVEYELIVQRASTGLLRTDASFHVHIAKQIPLVVMFDPEGFSYTYIVYAKQRADMDGTNPCYYDGRIVFQLDET